MATTGDLEAEFLREIADALAGTDVGLQSVGIEEAGFAIVIVIPPGVIISFLNNNPRRTKDAFLEWMEQRGRAGSTP